MKYIFSKNIYSKENDRKIINIASPCFLKHSLRKFEKTGYFLRWYQEYCPLTQLFFNRLCRLKKKAQAEANATAISNLLPFMEYEVHTQLMNKLKLKGMNALFGLRIQITVGENMLMGLAVSLRVLFLFL